MNKKYLSIIAIILILGSFHFYVLIKNQETILLQKEHGVMFTDHKVKNKKFLKEINPFVKLQLPDSTYSWHDALEGVMDGMIAFDANGDDLMDIYIPQNKQILTRPTDSNGVIEEGSKNNPNILLINMGNDDKGKPVFRPHYEIQKNLTFMREELLIEDLLFPRNRPDEIIDYSRGRIGVTATAVDINADGRLDLIVGNRSPGIIFNIKELNRIAPTFITPYNRKVRDKKILYRSLMSHLLNYNSKDEFFEMINSERGDHFYAQNSIYLNMGDKDYDGLPEWKDVTNETHFGGRRNTTQFTVFDFDLDGDLDVFETNIMDLDYWPGGSEMWAGAKNQLYVNQLIETGKLDFVEKSKELGVDGVISKVNPRAMFPRLRKIPLLPKDYSQFFLKIEYFYPELFKYNSEYAEDAGISWSSVAYDYNNDGYDDLIVADDLDFLKIYINQKGKGFNLLQDHPYSKHRGSWMSFAPGDFDGDLFEDLFIGNRGGGLEPILRDPLSFDFLLKPSLALGAFFLDDASSHLILWGKADDRFELPSVLHSKFLPPNSQNYLLRQNLFAALEFSWGSSSLDLVNNGKFDLYFLGGLYGRGGGSVFPVSGINPGRLLANDGHKKFTDVTAEYHAFNINELEYHYKHDELHISRLAPKNNWHKRSIVTNTDESGWSRFGPNGELLHGNQIRDMISLSENGKAVVVSDYNGDGQQDLLIRNSGGYDSRSSQSKNLKIKIDGIPSVLPGYDPNIAAPTNFEAGETYIFLNQEFLKKNNWIKVRLIDKTSKNFFGIGGSFSSHHQDIHVGLEKNVLKMIKVVWPDKDATTEIFKFSGLKNQKITLEKGTGQKVEI